MENIAVSGIGTDVEVLDCLRGPCPFSDRALLDNRYPPLPICRITPANAALVPVLVWGGAVVDRLRALEKDSCAVRWFDVAPADAVRVLLDYEHRPEGLSLDEAAGLLVFCDRLGIDVAAPENRDICKRVMPRGGFPQEVRRYLSLGDDLRALVSEGSLDLKSAVSTEQLTQADTGRLLPVLRRLKPNQSRVLLRRVVELAHREGASRDTPGGARPAAFLDELLSAEDTLDAAQRLLHPELTALEEKFSGLRHTLTSAATPGGRPVIHIQAPDSFEGNEFTVSFPLRSPADVGRAAAELTRLLERQRELEELCALLGS